MWVPQAHAAHATERQKWPVTIPISYRHRSFPMLQLVTSPPSTTNSDRGMSLHTSVATTLLYSVPSQGHVAQIYWANNACRPKVYSPIGRPR